MLLHTRCDLTGAHTGDSVEYEPEDIKGLKPNCVPVALTPTLGMWIAYYYRNDGNWKKLFKVYLFCTYAGVLSQNSLMSGVASGEHSVQWPLVFKNRSFSFGVFRCGGDMQDRACCVRGWREASRLEERGHLQR